jgi:hypothetical protein
MVLEGRGSVKLACLNCQNHVQRLQGVVEVATSSGSFGLDPGVLRPSRGTTHSIHNRSLDDQPWLCESESEAKTAAFLSLASGQIPVFSTFTRCNRLGAGAEHSSPSSFVHPP